MWTVALTGQTYSQGAFSQCMQGTAGRRCAARRRHPVEVAVDAEPVHLAPAHTSVLADDRDVVLGLAGDDAGAAADAGVEVDAHGPGNTVVTEGCIKRLLGRLTPQEFRLLQKLRERSLMNEITPVRGRFELHRSERMT